MTEGEHDGSVLVNVSNQGTRKRHKKVSVRDVAKNSRYSKPPGANTFTPCNHKSEGFQCFKVRPKDVLEFRNKLYNTCDKQLQDQMVSRYIRFSQVKRRRPRQPACLGLGLPAPDSKKKPHTVSTSYRFPTLQGLQILVCKTFFLHIIKFSADRVRQILKKLKLGKDFVENRGGDRVSEKSILKKNAVRKFIGNLRGVESHYNRKKSKRIYLPSDYSIRKLRAIYNESTISPNLKVSLTMFRRVHSGEFNIGFSSPASDICGYCAMLDNKLKNASGEKNKPS